MAQRGPNIFIKYLLRCLTTNRNLYLIIIFSLTLSMFFMQSNYQSDNLTLNYQSEILKNVENDARYAEVLRKASKLSKDIKYILLWTRQDYAPFPYFGVGQEGFIKSNCSQINCYVTADRSFFGGDLSQFHAIAFNGRNLYGISKRHLPKKRWPHQKYIYFNMESAHYYPVCNSIFEDFFNWTATYRLDSDIPTPYILIKDPNGKTVGPQINMTWPNKTIKIKEDIFNKVKNRTKAAAWFVSNCNSKSDRMRLYENLKEALRSYNLTVDLYGKCGKLKCPRENHTKCVEKLKSEYFFYLSLENSFSDDYVTEKLLTAVQNHVVPVVYGAANYSRFLPPNSYLNAMNQRIEYLAKEMNALMHDPVRYQEYLHRPAYYSYSNPSDVQNVCKVCDALHSDLYDQPSTYKSFQSWWNPKYESLCASMFSKIGEMFHSKIFGTTQTSPQGPKTIS